MAPGEEPSLGDLGQPGRREREGMERKGRASGAGLATPSLATWVGHAVAHISMLPSVEAAGISSNHH